MVFASKILPLRLQGMKGRRRFFRQDHGIDGIQDSEILGPQIPIGLVGLDGLDFGFAGIVWRPGR